MQKKNAIIFFSCVSSLFTQLGGIASESGSVSASSVDSNHAPLESASNDLPRMHEIDSGLWRGAQPTIKGIEELHKRKFKTLINFRTNESAIAEETEYAQKNGIKEVSMPIQGSKGPTNKQLDEFFSIVKDENSKPIYIHCDAGRDRTGVMTAIYRVRCQNWDRRRAYSEMLKMGFRRSFMWLSDCLFDFRVDDSHLHAPTAKQRTARAAKFAVTFPAIAYDVVRIHLHPPHNHLK